jgi:hypothetical protein
MEIKVLHIVFTPKGIKDMVLFSSTIFKGSMSKGWLLDCRLIRFTSTRQGGG